MALTYEKGKLYQISIIDFKPDPNQPRKVIDPEALAELAASIRQHGILQPLLFRVGKQEIGGHDPISPEIGIVSPDFPHGEIVERQKEYKTAEWKYLVQGASFKGRGICVVTKMSITGKLVIITVYAT